jgi:sensor c-di-GMP phosphodiesterase-like protein
MDSGFATRGWYEKYNHSMYAMTDTTAPTRIPKNATRIQVKPDQRGFESTLTALLDGSKMVNSIKHYRQ